MSHTVEVRASDLVVHSVEHGFPAFRIVKGASRGDPAVLDSLRSNYELDARPRGLERESALIQMGLSMYIHRAMAEATATRWPRIGGHIAQLHLEPGNGICFADTGQPGHMTVWGRPLQLLSCVADILVVGAA